MKKIIFSMMMLTIAACSVTELVPFQAEAQDKPKRFYLCEDGTFFPVEGEDTYEKRKELEEEPVNCVVIDIFESCPGEVKQTEKEQRS